MSRRPASRAVINRRYFQVDGDADAFWHSRGHRDDESDAAVIISIGAGRKMMGCR